MSAAGHGLRDRSTFVLLAGGESRRMGRDKALLTVGGREMLDRLLETGRRACGECVLVVNDAPRYADALRRYGWREAPGRGDPGGALRGDPERLARCFRRAGTALRMVSDRRPGLGPVAGLEAGLAAARGQLCYAAACDLPFLDAAVVRTLIGELADLRGDTRTSSAAAVVPVVGGRAQPLAAAYEAGADRAAAQCVAAGELSMDDLLGRLVVRLLDADELDEARGIDAGRCFVNVNRPEQLRAARSRARRRDRSR